MKKNRIRHYFPADNSSFTLGGCQLFQFREFFTFENFQAQTWVEHAIFALRERRLTTWPLRLEERRKNILGQLCNDNYCVLVLNK